MQELHTKFDKSFVQFFRDTSLLNSSGIHKKIDFLTDPAGMHQY